MSEPWSICSNSPENERLFKDDDEQTHLEITKQDLYDTNTNLEVAFAHLLVDPTKIPNLTHQESAEIELLRNPTKPAVENSFQQSFDQKPAIYKNLEPHFSSSFSSPAQFFTPSEVLMSEFVRSNSMKEQFFQSDIASAGPSNANSPCNSSFTGTSSTADSPESGTDETVVSHSEEDMEAIYDAQTDEWEQPSSECSSPDSINASPNRQHTTTAVRTINSPRRRNLNSAKLWEWILHLLLKPHKYEHVVSWEDRERGLFKIHNERELTKLYNSYKNTVESRGGRQQPSRARNPETGIKYESILRALRHCYKTRVMVRVNRKHKYEFGPNAHEWQLGLTRVNAINSIERWEENFITARHNNPNEEI
ncbi:uncharacterized protein LOC142344514 isoform X2 [Convolutriloba macropyga]|uniref:uncharacterized protein LOC142344514 isoform X2 n=1 Tax=Convolutriloba macropyga TaxID=536237 RepID=UPI003F526628